MQDTLSILHKRLNETVAWCEHRTSGSPSTILRSPELQPALSFLITHSNGAALPQPCEVQGWHLETVETAKRKNVVDDLARKRREILVQRAIEIGAPMKKSRKGRFLLYNPNLNHLYSGIPEVASNGFFEIDNSPPWDTWVAYIQQGEEVTWSDFLLCWIPAPFVLLASAGVSADNELDQCLVWADEITLPFTNRMREVNLLAARL